MNIKRLGITTLFVATVAVAIPQAASAETVTIEAVETSKGKAPSTHRFSVELSDRETEVEWSDRHITLDVALLARPAKDATAPRRLSYKVRVNSRGQRLKLQSVARLIDGKRHVIGRVAGKDRTLELAMIVTQ